MLPNGTRRLSRGRPRRHTACLASAAALAAGLALATPVLAQTAGDLANLDRQAAVAAQDDAIARALAAKTGAMAKVGSALSTLYEQEQAQIGRRALAPDEALAPSDPTVRTVDGKVAIDAVASGDTATLLQDLQALGLERGSAFGHVVSGLLPIDALADAANLSSLVQARPAAAATRIGAVTSQGDRAMASDLTRIVFGVRGRGVTVGVLSDSYDCLGGAAGDIASGDLPRANRITILDDTACPGSDEGRGMMQLVRDVAPGARQAFHTAFNGQADFANGIIQLAEEAGADVIVDDVIYFAEPMFQDGIIAQAVDQVKAGGAAYFSSSGNDDRNSWESGSGGFVPSGVPGVFGGQRHDFDPGPGIDDLQTIVIGTGTTIFSFQWDEPFASVSGAPGSASDLDILLYLPDGTFIGLGGALNNLDGDPVEVFGVVNSGPPVALAVGLELFAGPAPGFMKVNIFDPRVDTIGDPATSFFVEHKTDSGANYGHSNAAGAAAVGAAFWRQTPRFGVFPARVENFSSAGGTPILFDLAGNFIAPEIRDKPNFVAPDGGVTTFFGGRDSFGASDPTGNHFFGTSASAPHAAAVAALMLEANRQLDPDRVYEILEDTALDMDDPATPGFDLGFDFGTGHGFINSLFAVWKAKRSGRHGDDDGDDDD